MDDIGADLVVPICSYCGVNDSIGSCADCGQAHWCENVCRIEHWIDGHQDECEMLGSPYHPVQLEMHDNLELLEASLDVALAMAADDALIGDHFVDLGNTLADQLLEVEGEIPHELETEVLTWISEVYDDPYDKLSTEERLHLFPTPEHALTFISGIISDTVDSMAEFPHLSNDDYEFLEEEYADLYHQYMDQGKTLTRDQMLIALEGGYLHRPDFERRPAHAVPDRHR